MERKIPFKDLQAYHVEVLNSGVTVTITASVRHECEGPGLIAMVDHTTVVSQNGRPILTVGPRTLKLTYFGGRPKYIGTYSLSINRQKVKIGCAGKAFHDMAAVPKYLCVKIEQD